MLSSILTLVVAFLSLIVLMAIHEFGHFIIAKKFGLMSSASDIRQDCLEKK